MKKIKNPEKLSLVFFFILLVLLPLILTSNKEEKMILSKAEETSNATPSATIYPTTFIPTQSLYPTAHIVPTLSFISPTQAQYPTITQLPTITQSQIQPSPPILKVSIIPSISAPVVSISPVAPTSFIYPTSFIQPTQVVSPPIIPQEKTPVIKNILPSIPIEQTTTFFGNFVTVLNDIFGVYVSSPEKTSVSLNASGSVREAVISPTFNNNDYLHVQFLERDIIEGALMQWIDKLFKKDRTRVITYEMIMNPEGFVHTSQIVLTMRASRGAFDIDEPSGRKQILTNANIAERIYFDRFGFFEDASQTSNAYSLTYNRIHSITITNVVGAETNKQTPLTLDQWDGFGLGELRDEQGLSMTSSMRAQSAIIKNKYGNFDPEISAFSMNELYDIIQWINSQSESPYARITRDQLAQLLAKDDSLTVRVE